MDWSNTEIVVAWIGAGVSVIMAFIGFLSNRQTLTHNKKVLEFQRTQDRKKEIYKKLNDFYGPMLQLLEKSKLLYDLFRRDKEFLKAPDEERFSTLTCLMRGHIFQGTDKTMLKSIESAGIEIETLIKTRAGLIDSPNPELKKTLALASTHYEIMRKALNHDVETGEGLDLPFRDYTFPKELAKLLEQRVKELKEELNTI